MTFKDEFILAAFTAQKNPAAPPPITTRVDPPDLLNEDELISVKELTIIKNKAHYPARLNAV